MRRAAEFWAAAPKKRAAQIIRRIFQLSASAEVYEPRWKSRAGFLKLVRNKIKTEKILAPILWGQNRKWVDYFEKLVLRNPKI